MSGSLVSVIQSRHARDVLTAPNAFIVFIVARHVAAGRSLGEIDMPGCTTLAGIWESRCDDADLSRLSLECVTPASLSDVEPGTNWAAARSPEKFSPARVARQTASSKKRSTGHRGLAETRNFTDRHHSTCAAASLRRSLDPAARAHGVVAVTRENHAIVLPIRRNSRISQVVMPQTQGPARIALCKELGADVYWCPMFIRLSRAVSKSKSKESRP